jgi:hypothetical protein
MKKIILIILLLVAIGGASTAYYLWNKPKRTAADEKPVASMSADDLLMAFQTDEVKANASYLNKIIEVTGIVVKKEKDDSGNEVVYLETTDVFGLVSCTMIPGSACNAGEGQETKLKGICTGYLSDVVLTQCAH